MDGLARINDALHRELLTEVGRAVAVVLYHEPCGLSLMARCPE